MKVPDSILRAYVQRWCHAVVHQADRVANQAFGLEREMDCQLFAFALRQFLVAVELSATESGLSVLSEALDRFSHAFPHAKEIRDQLVHFEDYERGVGRLQKHPQQGMRPIDRSSALLLPVTPWSQETNQHGWVVELQLGDYRLPVVAAARAARSLGNEVVSVMSTLPNIGHSSP